MEWSNTLSISQLFLTHDVTIVGPNHEVIIVHLPSLREQLTNSFFSKFIQIFDSDSLELWRKFAPDAGKGQILQLLMTEPKITNIKEFSFLSKLLHEHITDILPQFNVQNRLLYSGDTPLTDDAVDEILFVLLQGIGKTVERPQHFGPGEEMARKFYERAQMARAKANRIRAEAPNQSNRDGLMDMFVMISYSFPYTFEQMYDMTLMQLHYLQHMSSKMMSYEHNMMAYTAGNLKKAPQFFLK